MTIITTAGNDHTINRIFSINEKLYSVIFLYEETFTKCVMPLGMHYDQLTKCSKVLSFVCQAIYFLMQQNEVAYGTT